MTWKLIRSGANTGEHNMDFDLRLAQQCNDGEAFFRLYKWQPYSISLGANQNFDEVNKAKTESGGIDVVKRPTGGRAILHAEEITYSVVIPVSYGLSPREVYNKVSIALTKGLALYNPALVKSELENLQPDFAQLLKQPQGSLCFASTAKSEVKYAGKKLIGSAQRKLKNIILQHGSILCGTYHQKLPEYLNYGEEEIIKLRKELTDKTTEIETILNTKVDYELLEKKLIEGFSEEWQIKFDESSELLVN